MVHSGPAGFAGTVLWGIDRTLQWGIPCVACTCSSGDNSCSSCFQPVRFQVVELLKREGFRVEADLSDARMNAKIRTAQTQKIPYMLVVGSKEEQTGTVSVRTRTGDQISSVSIQQLVELLKVKIERKEPN